MKENEAIKDRIIRDIKKRSEQKEDYYKAVREVNLYRKNYIEFEVMVTKIKPYQSKNNLMKLNQCMKVFINNLQKFDEEHIMHSKSDNIEFMIYDKLSKKMKVSKNFLNHCLKVITVGRKNQ